MSRSAAPSPNLAVLDSQIFASLCEGKFFIDITPSVWIGEGATSGLGVKVQITSPVGVVIKPYTDNYDIEPPFEDIFEYSIPTQGGNFQYGTYKVAVQYVDADEMVYDLEKNVRITEPDPNNKTKKWGTLTADMRASCKEGKLKISVSNLPVYCGKTFQTRVNAFVFKYPTGTLDNEDVAVTNFSAQLFEGRYLLEGTVCATYNFGENVFVDVLYKLKCWKDVKCVLDATCVSAQLNNLYERKRLACGQEKEDLEYTISEAFRLINLATYLADNNGDPTAAVDDLEKLLGCSCTCNCNEGVPIINDDPVSDISIEGCNVVQTTYGLTTIWRVDNYDYEIDIPVDTAGALTISEPALDADGCKKTQHLAFDIARVYAQIKAQADADDEDFWASILKKVLNGLDLSCMDITSYDLETLTFLETIQAIVNKACTGGSACEAAISTHSVATSGSDAIVSFTANADTQTVDIYLDNVLQGTVYYSGATTFTLVGASDGSPHTYRLVPKCSSGLAGTSTLSDEFTFLGCPTLAAPVLTETYISDASCPTDLTDLEYSVPAGITIEWHNQNNHNSSSLVATPTSVSSGVYYAFAKNSDGCYSVGVAVTIICESTSCSAPQNLLVVAITGGNRISFQSAAAPPPSNSYTVKRRLSSAPDVSGSYTTIGTPAWNASSARWEILDSTASNNVLYVYKAISNCGVSSPEPSVDYSFANIDCPTVTLTPTNSTIGYSFTNPGGGISKYDVKLYNAAGNTLIDTDTILPAFSSPITGSFIYLDENTSYKVRLRIYIGTYYKDCDFTTAITQSDNYTLSAAYNFSIDSVSGVGVPTLPATGLNNSEEGHHTAMSGTYSVVISGTVVTPCKLVVYVNNVVVDCQNIASAGTKTTGAVTAAESDEVLIAIDAGTC